MTTTMRRCSITTLSLSLLIAPILLSWISDAFPTPSSSSHRTLALDASRARTDAGTINGGGDDDHDGADDGISVSRRRRRDCFGRRDSLRALALLSSSALSSAAAAATDPLADLGRSLQTTNTTANTDANANTNDVATTPAEAGEEEIKQGAVWPDTPSPLPTAVKSAAELTAKPLVDGTLKNKSGVGGTLDGALMDAVRQQKRRVDPMTHGVN